MVEEKSPAYLRGIETIEELKKKYPKLSLQYLRGIETCQLAETTARCKGVSSLPKRN